MNYLNGGYVMLDKADSDIFAKASGALQAGKPILWYENKNTCYYIDTLAKSGSNVVLTKGGKTITITDANVVTETGDIQNHLFVNYATSVYLQTTAGDYRGTYIITTNKQPDDIQSTDFTEIKTYLTELLKDGGIINIIESDGDTSFIGSIYFRNNKIWIEGYNKNATNYVTLDFDTLENDSDIELTIAWNTTKLF